LDVGDELWTPDVAVLREKYPYLCPKERKRQPGTARIATVSVPYNSGGRSYVVESGDTQYDIARYELGSGGRWPEIYVLNRDRLGEDIDYLKPGTQLALPTAEGQTSPGQADAITQRPTGVLPR
jgi:nucleoid-associated protein YgaU